jgi:dTDP-4-amino-4,6-dideoxygalactose transaminase
MQAAILRVKLPLLIEHNERRRTMAASYSRRLIGVEIPRARNDAMVRHVFHLYVIRHRRRDALRDALRRRGIDSQIHYPVPVHLQPAYGDLGYRRGSLPMTEQAAEEVLSLPLFIGLTDEQVDTVACAINDSVEELIDAKAA